MEPRLWRIVPTERGKARLEFDFHRGQRRAVESQKRFILCLAGWQSGKTVIGPPWLYLEIVARGPGDYFIGGPSLTLLEKKVLPDFRRLFERQLRLGKFVGGRQQAFTFSDQGCRRLFGHVPPDPVRVIFGHAGNPDSLESAQYKAAWLDEAGQKAFRLASWEAVLGRLSIAQGRVLLTSRPYDLGWMKQVLYDPWEKSGRNHPLIDVVNFRSIDNPVFPREEYERAKASMPAWRFLMKYHGLFTRPAGLIYDCFDDGRHVIPWFSVPRSWPRWLGLDFGGVHTAGVFLAEELGVHNERTGRLFAYRVYGPAGNAAARQHADHLLAGEPGMPNAVGGSGSEDQWRDEFGAAGLPVREPAVTGPDSVEVGISRVYEAIKRDQLVVLADNGTNGTGKLLDELQSYSRELDDMGEPTREIDNKESYHVCFVAGTQVLTARGLVPIEKVRLDDYALTRKGFRRVLGAGLTGRRLVWQLDLSNGGTLIATPDHPIWVEEEGFIRLDALRYGDRMLTCQEGTQIDGGRKCEPLASYGCAIPTRRGLRTANTSGTGGCICTGLHGRRTVEKSRTASMSTTGTRTPATIPLRTWNFCLGLTTLAVTERVNAPHGCWRTLSGFALSPRHGIPLKRAGLGTESTPSPLIEDEGSKTESRKCASIAARSIDSYTRRRAIGFAPTHAVRPRGGSLGLMTLIDAVNGAVRRFGSTVMRRRDAAPVHVLRTSPLGRHLVYNLSVAGAREYFANGVLVSNCDALRYVVGYLKPGLSDWGNQGELPHDLRGEVVRAPAGVFLDDYPLR